MNREHEPTGHELAAAESTDALSAEELAAQDGQALPEREAMSSLNLNISGVDNFAMPINEATAINSNSANSVAAADADQTVILTQAAEAEADEPSSDGS